MKLSRYNLIVNSENGDEDLVYNTLTGAIVRGNRAFTDVISDKDVFSLIRADFDDELSDNGMMVGNGEDELETYRQMHEEWKSGKQLAEFNMLITYDCNFECPYCYQGRGEKGQEIHAFKPMDPAMIDTFKTFVKRTVEERESRKMELVLYGGEPLKMERECMTTTDELAEWARDNEIGFGLHMLSNGSLMKPEFVKWASDYGMRLQVPVDGSKSMHDKIRFYKDTGKGSFDDVTKALALTRDTDVETHIRISLTDETYPTMERMLDELQKRDLTHIYTDFCYITAFTSACSNYENHVLDDQKLFDVMPKLWREAYNRGFRLDIRPHPQPLPCSSIADGSFIVDPFGDVYKCWELVGLQEHVVGRLNEDGTMEQTDVYGDVLERDPTRIKQCASHSYLPSCGGGCVCKAYWQKGTYNTPGCGTENFLLPEKVRMAYEMTDPLISKTRINEGMEMQLVDGPVEPSMSHCYVLV